MKISFLNYSYKSYSPSFSGDKRGKNLSKEAEKKQTLRQPSVAGVKSYVSQPIKGSLIYHSVMDSLHDKMTNPWFASEELKKTEEVLERNKEELEKVFGSSFYAMKKKYNFSRSDFSYESWLPYMSRQRAEDYVQGSFLAGETLYRGSHSPEAAKEHGYKLSRVGLSYPGIYVSDSRETASMYGVNPLALKVRANNIVRLRGFDGFEERLFNEFKKHTQNRELLKTLESIKGIVEYRFGKELNIDAFEQRVQAFEEDIPSLAYIVLNPKNIVIING